MPSDTPQRSFLNGKNLPVNTIVWFHSFHVFYLTSVFSPFCWIEIGFGWRAQGNEWVRCVKNTEWPTSIMIFFSPFSQLAITFRKALDISIRGHLQTMWTAEGGGGFPKCPCLSTWGEGGLGLCPCGLWFPHFYIWYQEFASNGWVWYSTNNLYYVLILKFQ